jgi:hypothetical protein
VRCCTQFSRPPVIKNTLKLHKPEYDEKAGTILITDFYQLSQILESLKEQDRRAFNALIAANPEFEETVRERGSRIARLQRGQNQPK